jgi:hypothetical protein
MPMTPKQRAAKVVAAITELATSIETAVDTLTEKGPTHADTLTAWGDVEKAGATVQRQSRLLAGKSKGG